MESSRGSQVSPGRDTDSSQHQIWEGIREELKVVDEIIQIKCTEVNAFKLRMYTFPPAQEQDRRNCNFQILS